MRRLLGTYLHALALVLIVTFILAYPQAQAVGAPDRGFLATSVTMALFFGAALAGLLIPVAILARLGIWVSQRLLPVMADRSRRWLALAWGAVAMILALLITPFGSNPTDTAGLVAAWIVTAGFGAMAAEAGALSRAAIAISAIGCALAATIGFSVLVLSAV